MNQENQNLPIIPDAIIKELESRTKAAKRAEEKAKEAASQELSANFVIFIAVWTWILVCFDANDRKEHIYDFWMYLLIVQLLYITYRWFKKSGDKA